MKDKSNLILQFKKYETVQIGNDIEITYLGRQTTSGKNRTNHRIGIRAPREVLIKRVCRFYEEDGLHVHDGSEVEK